MSRGLGASEITAIGGNPTFCHLVYIGFSTPLYLTDWNRDVPYSGQTYDADGGLAEIVLAAEDARQNRGTFNIVLMNATTGHAATALTEDFIDVSVYVYRVLLDSDGDIIGSHIVVSQGYISSLAIVDDMQGGVSTVLWDCKSKTNFEKSSGIIGNDNDQQSRYSGDKFFEFAHLSRKDVGWGRSTIIPPVKKKKDRWYQKGVVGELYDFQKDFFNQLGGHIGTIFQSLFGLLGVDFEDDDSENGILLNSTDPTGEIPVIYGQREVGGKLEYWSTGGTDNEHIYMVLSVSLGEIESIDEIYLDRVSIRDVKFTEAEIGDDTENVIVNISRYLGTTTQTTETTFMPSEWSGSDHSGKGIAYIALKLKYNPNVFSGRPQVTCDIRGKKVYDYNTQATIYSSNPANCIADYITDPIYGMGGSVDSTSFTTAAAFCDTTLNQRTNNPTGWLVKGEYVRSSESTLINTTKSYPIADNTGGAFTSPNDAFVGAVISGTYSSTVALDGTFHRIDVSGGNDLSVVYKINIGADGAPDSITWSGYLDGVNNYMGVWLWDFSASEWIYIKHQQGQSGTTVVGYTYDVSSDLVGTTYGDDLGDIYIRFKFIDQSSAELFTDQIYCTFQYTNSITIDTGTNNPVIGDQFTSGSDTTLYTVTEYDSGTGLLSITPNLTATTPDNTALDFTMKYFACNGKIDTEGFTTDNLNKLKISCRAITYDKNGSTAILIEGTGSDGESYTIDEDSIIGAVSLVDSGKNIRLNRIKMRFANPVKAYAADYAVTLAATHTTLLAEDNGYLLETEKSLPFETNYYRAAYMAETLLKLSRTAKVIKCRLTIEAMQMAVGDIKDFSYARFGYTNKAMRVRSMKNNIDGTVDVSLSEHYNTNYDRTILVTHVVPADTTSPNPDYVPVVSDLDVSPTSSDTLKFSGYGNFWSRLKVTWTASTNHYVVGYEIQYKESKETSYIIGGIVDGRTATQFWINNVRSDIKYDVRARALNFNGRKGAWAYDTQTTAAGRNYVQHLTLNFESLDAYRVDNFAGGSTILHADDNHVHMYGGVADEDSTRIYKKSTSPNTPMSWDNKRNLRVSMNWLVSTSQLVPELTAIGMGFAPLVGRSDGFVGANVSTGSNTITVNGFFVDDEIYLTAGSGGTLPSPLSAATTYYVVQDSTSMQLATSKGGSVINITDTGSDGAGDHTIQHDKRNGLFMAHQGTTNTIKGYSSNDSGTIVSVALSGVTDEGNFEIDFDPTTASGASDTFTSSSIDDGNDTIAVDGLYYDMLVKVTEGTTLPTGMAEDTPYFVIQDSPLVKISATRGGSALAISADGSGTHTIAECAHVEFLYNGSSAGAIVTNLPSGTTDADFIFSAEATSVLANSLVRIGELHFDEVEFNQLP